MTELIVSRHALDRYRERVADVSDSEAFARLSTPAFEIAAAFGAPLVKLASGNRAVVRSGTVVTVLPKELSLDKAWRVYDREVARG